MKVKFNEVVAGPHVLYNMEDVYDLDKNEANRLIEKNIARPTTQAEEALAEEKAVIELKLTTPDKKNPANKKNPASKNKEDKK